MSTDQLIFVRHGETDWNRVLRLQGHTDTPLNAIGRRQAARNGRALAGILAGREMRCLCSPLSRARETADIVVASAGRSDIAVETDKRLMEIAYGAWEGLTLPEVLVSDPQGYKRREIEKWKFTPPSGESYEALAARVLEWHREVNGPLLVVAHGGILRVLLHLLAGWAVDEVPFLAIPQDRVYVFGTTHVLTL